MKHRERREPTKQLALDIRSPRSVESYHRAEPTKPAKLVREVRGPTGCVYRSELSKPKNVSRTKPTPENYDLWWLRSTEEPNWPKYNPVHVVDLFSGCGGLSLGIREACRAVGRGFQVDVANDVNPTALAVYVDNFSPTHPISDPIETLVEDRFNRPASDVEESFCNMAGTVTFLVGGPPCQGHSDLNNHTRRDDPKNTLYVRMARAAELLEPRHIIIENVPGVRHDKSNIVGETMRRLESLKYNVNGEVLGGIDFGIPQSRRRYFLVATKTTNYNLTDAITSFRVTKPRTLKWAIGDLEHSPLTATTIFNKPSKPTAINQSRMNWFFRPENRDVYNLPNSERPDCHRLKPHSYVGVYGRMRWDEPAPTITGGFGCAGQGRFVHPSPIRGTASGRTITPHEAARIQFFPDFFNFDAAWMQGRGALHQMVGNAVPSKFAYAIALSLLLADHHY